MMPRAVASQELGADRTNHRQMTDGTELITKKGIRIRYSLVGTGNDLVVVAHPVFGSALYRKTLSRLALRFRVLFYDIVSIPDVEVLAADSFSTVLRELMERTELHRPVLFGHSLSSNIAVQFACMHPGRCSGLILVAWTDESAAMQRAMKRKHRERCTSSKYLDARKRLTAESPRLAERTIERLFQLMLQFHAPEKVVDMLSDIDPSVLAPAVDGPLLPRMMELEETIVRSPDHDIPGPVLLVWGADDPGADLRKIPNPHTSVVLIPEAGHFPWVENPASFYGTLGDLKPEMWANSPPVIGSVNTTE